MFYNSKCFKTFLGFLFFGVILGFVENILVVSLATNLVINLQTILISLCVVIPFAIIGELLVDKIAFFGKTKSKKIHALEVFLELLFFGILMGVVEDFIIIFFLTGGLITVEMLIIMFLVTLPFSILGEVIIDNRDWFDWMNTMSKKAKHFL